MTLHTTHEHIFYSHISMRVSDWLKYMIFANEKLFVFSYLPNKATFMYLLTFVSLMSVSLVA